MTLAYKSGVKLFIGLSKEMEDAAKKVDSVYGQHGVAETVVTSALDGVHSSAASLHYKGQALDFRIWAVPPDQRRQLVKDLQATLGPDYDVLLEQDHVHVEFDPKPDA